MSTTTLLGLLSWGIALYLWRNGNRIRQTSMAIKGMQNPVFAPSLMSKIVYVLLGVLAGSALFVGVALADGADPFDHFQRVLQAPVKIVPTPSALSTATPTLMLSITPSPTLLPTGTLPAITPQTNATPAPGNDGGQGWEKTPNGQGGGQFQTPPGQGGVPPGQQPKPTNEPKPTKDNNSGGNSKDNSSKSKP